MDQERIPSSVDEEQMMLTLNKSIDALGDTEITELVSNLESFRTRLAQLQNEKTRDINKACGYPQSVSEITVRTYRELYESDPIAARLNNIFSDECWQSFPEIYEEEKVDDVGEGGDEGDDTVDEGTDVDNPDDTQIDPTDEDDVENDDNPLEDELNDVSETPPPPQKKKKAPAKVKSKGTPFEERLKQVGQNMVGPGYYDPEALNPLFSWLWRADRNCGVGRYGGVLLGINDIGPNDDLMKPLTLATVPGYPPIDNDPNVISKSKQDDPTAGPDLLNEGHYLVRNDDPEKKQRELLFLRVLDEGDLQVAGWEERKNSPRYMRPTSYQLTIRTPQTLAVPTEQLTRIHWTRVVHVADLLYTDEVLAFPRLQQGYNRLKDLQKLYGGSAEMYWQGAFPGIMFQNLPQLAGRVEPPTPKEIQDMKKQLKDYFAQLKRYMHLGNMEANLLAPAVADPSNQIMVQIEALCILYGIPKRIFMGSERGELSSSQDMRKWLGVLKNRQDRWITPFLIVPFINRLILCGVLPVPKQFYVKWPDLGSMTDLEKAQAAMMKMQACSAYTMSVMQILSEQDFWVRFMDMTEEEAQQIINNAVEQASENMMTGMQQGGMGGQPGQGQFGGGDQFGADDSNEPTFGG